MSTLEFAKATRPGIVGQDLQLAGIAWGFVCVSSPTSFFLSILGCCRAGWKMGSDPSSGISIGLEGWQEGQWWWYEDRKAWFIAVFWRGCLGPERLLVLPALKLWVSSLYLIWAPTLEVQHEPHASGCHPPSQTQLGLVLCSWLQPPTTHQGPWAHLAFQCFQPWGLTPVPTLALPWNRKVPYSPGIILGCVISTSCHPYRLAPKWARNKAGSSALSLPNLNLWSDAASSLPSWYCPESA